MMRNSVIRENFGSTVFISRGISSNTFGADFAMGEDDLHSSSDLSVFTSSGSSSTMFDDNLNNLSQIFTAQYSCSNCDIKSSPIWRRGPLGPKTLCDSCGLKWSSGKMNLDENGGGGPKPGHPFVNFQNAGLDGSSVNTQSRDPFDILYQLSDTALATSRSVGYDDFVDFIRPDLPQHEQEEDFAFLDTFCAGDSVDKMLTPRKTISVNCENILSSATPPSSLLSFSSTTILNSISNRSLTHNNSNVLLDNQTLSSVVAATASSNCALSSNTPPLAGIDGELVTTSAKSPIPRSKPFAVNRRLPTMPATVNAGISFTSVNACSKSGTSRSVSPIKPIPPPQSSSAMVFSSNLSTSSPISPSRSAGKRKSVANTAMPVEQHHVTPLKITRSMHRSKKICSNCGVTKAPVWRKGPLGTSTLCNACGLKYSLGTVLLDPLTGAVPGRPGYLIFVEEGEDIPLSPVLDQSEKQATSELATNQSEKVIKDDDDEIVEEQCNAENKTRKKNPKKKRRISDEDDLIDAEELPYESRSEKLIAEQASANNQSSTVEEHSDSTAFSYAPLKRARGRPRKKPFPEQELQQQNNAVSKQPYNGPPRSRGRPRKGQHFDQEQDFDQKMTSKPNVVSSDTENDFMSEFPMNGDSVLAKSSVMCSEIKPFGFMTWHDESGDLTFNYTTRSNRHIRRPSRFEDFADDEFVSLDSTEEQGDYTNSYPAGNATLESKNSSVMGKRKRQVSNDDYDRLDASDEYDDDDDQQNSNSTKYYGNSRVPDLNVNLASSPLPDSAYNDSVLVRH